MKKNTSQQRKVIEVIKIECTHLGRKHSIFEMVLFRTFEPKIIKKRSDK